MKKIIALALLAVVATGANAKGKKQPKVDPNKPYSPSSRRTPSQASRTRTVQVPAGPTLP